MTGFTVMLGPTRITRLTRLTRLTALTTYSLMVSSSLGPLSYQLTTGFTFTSETFFLYLTPMESVS